MDWSKHHGVHPPLREYTSQCPLAKYRLPGFRRRVGGRRWRAPKKRVYLADGARVRLAVRLRMLLVIYVPHPRCYVYLILLLCASAARRRMCRPPPRRHCELECAVSRCAMRAYVCAGARGRRCGARRLGYDGLPGKG